MTFRESQSVSRSRYLANYDETAAKQYDHWVTTLDAEDHDACLADISRVFQFSPGMSVLDAGAGTGALTLALTRVNGIRITALEPSETMGTLLSAKPGLSSIPVVNSFCDHRDDRSVFPSCSFDVVASRLLVNCLYDPLAAFSNWYHWLRPGGTVIIMDGQFTRDDWTGVWEDVVDTLPLSACQTTACVPYLLESCGFRCLHTGMMHAVNGRPTTRTRRFMVVAIKVGAAEPGLRPRV